MAFGLSAGVAWVDIVPNLKNFSSQLNKEFDKHAKSVGKAAGVAGLAIAAGLAVGAKKAIDSAKDVNEALSAVDASFGKSAGKVKAWSKDTTDAFSQVDFLGAAKSFGVFGRAAGLGDEATAGFAKSLISAAQDMASFHNADPSEVLDNLRSGLAGETEPLRKFGIIMSETALAEHAVKEGIIGRGETMTDQEKVLARQSFIMQNLGAAEGDWLRTRESAANVERTQAANTTDLVAKLGQGLLPVYTKLLNVGLKIVDYLGKHTGLVKILAIGLGILATVFLTLSAAISIATLANTLFGVSIAAVALPITIIVLGLIALGAGLILLWKKSETFRDIVKGVWKAIGIAFEAAKIIIEEVIDVIVGLFGNLPKRIKQVFDAAWGPIKAYFTTLFAVYKALVLFYVDAVVFIFTKLPGRIRSAFSAGWGAVKAFFSGIWVALRDFVSDRVDNIVGFFRALPGRISAWFGELRSKLGSGGPLRDIFINLKDFIGEKVDNIVDFYKNLPNRIWNGIKEKAGWLKDKLTEFFKNILPGWVEDALGISSPSKVFERIGNYIMEGLLKGIRNRAGDIKNAVSGLFQGGSLLGPTVELGVQGGIVALGHLLQKMGFQVGEHPAFGGVHPVHVPGSYHYSGRALDVNWPGGGPAEMSHLDALAAALRKVPGIAELLWRVEGHFDHLHVAMAKGGIVTRATRALIGEAGPEAVIPLSKKPMTSQTKAALSAVKDRWGPQLGRATLEESIQPVFRKIWDMVGGRFFPGFARPLLYVVPSGASHGIFGGHVELNKMIAQLLLDPDPRRKHGGVFTLLHELAHVHQKRALWGDSFRLEAGANLFAGLIDRQVMNRLGHATGSFFDTPPNALPDQRKLISTMGSKWRDWATFGQFAHRGYHTQAAMDNILNFDRAMFEGGIATRPIRALIGEAGREAVIPLDSEEGRRLLGGGATVNVEEMNVRDPFDIELVAAQLFRKAQSVGVA